MSERARALAERFEQANNKLIAAVNQCSDEQWRANCQELGWSVAVTAHHVGAGHAVIADLASKVANGEELPPITMEMLDQMNAQHAQEHASCTKEETLAMLRDGGSAAAQAVRGLDDEQLGRSGALLVDMPPMTTEQVIENILIGHPRQHLENIRGAMSG
jgi:uncharacterized damage-inducible protein DinB